MPLMRNGLQRDEVTERLTRYSTAEFRVWVATVFVAMIIAGAFASVFAQGTTAVVAACLTVVTLAVGVGTLLKERRLLNDYKTAVATVSEWKRTDGVEGGYYYEVKYRFLASDGKLYIGSSGACSRELPHEGETVPILYRANKPKENLTLASFLFYTFFYTGTE
jgi:Protein of unknown function (DUF3592)